MYIKSKNSVFSFVQILKFSQKYKVYLNHKKVHKIKIIQIIIVIKDKY